MSLEVFDEKDYAKKANELFRHINPKALLKKWELEHLPLNGGFHFFLVRAIGDKIVHQYGLFNRVLIHNPHIKLEDLKSNSRIYYPLVSLRDYVYFRGLSYNSKNELGFDLVEIVKPIVEKHLQFYPAKNFEWIQEFKTYFDKCKYQYILLEQQKKDLNEKTFKRKLTLTVRGLQQEIYNKEVIYLKANKPKNSSLVEIYDRSKKYTLEREQLFWTKFNNRILIDFTKAVFPEFEELDEVINLDTKKTDEGYATQKKGKKKKKEPTFLGLFRNDEDRMNTFFSLLKGLHFKALDKQNNWIYNDNERKGSIVACFAALKKLDYIRFKGKAELRRIVESKIIFEGNKRLFYDDYNQEDYDNFIDKFKKHLP